MFYLGLKRLKGLRSLPETKKKTLSWHKLHIQKQCSRSKPEFQVYTYLKVSWRGSKCLFNTHTLHIVSFVWE